MAYVGGNLLGVRSSAKDECMKHFHVEKEKLKLSLMNLDGQISLSVQILRCPESNVYMRLNAHFVDENWKLQKWIINYNCVQTEVIDDYPEGAIMRVVSDWGIRNKISALAYESDWFDKELLDLNNHVQENRKLHLDGKLFNLPCCAEVFRSMAEDAFEGNEKVIHKIEELWCSGKHHFMWKHTYKTMKDTFEAHTKENFFAKDEYDNYYEKPSPEEWNQVKDLCQVLDILYGAAEVLFETKHLTANMYLPNLQELRRKLIDELKNSDSFMANIAGKMLHKFEKYFKPVFLVLAVATVMDPRCKMKYIKFLSVEYASTDGNSEITTVFEAMHTLYDEYVGDSTSPNSEEAFKRPVKKRQRNQPDEGFNWLSEYKQFVKSDQQQLQSLLPPPKPPAKTELELYLEEPVVPWSKGFDILSWWKQSSPKYPVLSRIARDALAVPLSATTGHDAYWVAREIDPYLEAMGQDAMNAYMCKQSWSGKQ